MIRRLVAVVVVAVATAPTTACGIPLDDEPRASANATTTTVGAPVPRSGNSSAYLYFVTDNLLVNLDREVVSESPKDVLTPLFAGVPSGEGDEIVSQIPNGTRLLGIHQNGEELDVDLSKEFDNLVGAGRTQATAQIVMTATDLGGVDEVGILINGQRTQVFSPVNGDSERVGACDYVGLLPTDDLINSWPLDRKSQRHLITRRNMLQAQCGDVAVKDN
jgi:spore germination protein GerM